VPRKKKPVEAVHATQAEATSRTPSMHESVATDIISPPPAPELVETKPTPTADTSNEPPVKIWATSGPMWETTVNLSTQNDGPKMRFGRNNKYRQMVIQFDQAPCQDVLDELYERTWKPRPAEGVWTRQLELGHEARGHADAARCFDHLVALERRARGLDARRAVSR
jgi:hypothetical protein